MAGFLLRRAIALVATLLVASAIVFAALYVTGDPLASLTGGRTLEPEAIEKIKEQYHLDEPLVTRYFLWLGDVAQGDFGESITRRESVGHMLTDRFATTFMLLGYAGVLIVVFGIGVGTVAATGRRIPRFLATVASTAGLATPAFVAAMFLITVFAVNLGWFPVFGAGEGFLDRIWHLTLPAIALSISLAAYVSRITRAAVTEELDSEHVETAHARGLPERTIVRRHVLRNAMIPISTAATITVTSTLASMIIVERAFSLDGIGSLMVESAAAGDFPVVQAGVLLMIACFIVATTLLDILYAYIDPRVKLA